MRMTHNEYLIDKNDFLTEKGREILQLVLIALNVLVINHVYS